MYTLTVAIFEYQNIRMATEYRKQRCFLFLLDLVKRMFFKFLESDSIWFSFKQTDYEAIMKQLRDGIKGELERNLATERWCRRDTNMTQSQVFSDHTRRLYTVSLIFNASHLDTYWDILFLLVIFFFITGKTSRWNNQTYFQYIC